MLAPEWTWWTSLPVILAAIALLWIPGGAWAIALGAGRWPSIALAPVLTTSLISVGGIVCGLIGVRWGLGPLAVSGLGVPLASLAVRWLVRRRGLPVPTLGTTAVPVREVLVGGFIAAVVVVVTVVRGVGQPGDIPQQPDAIFHLGAVRYLIETGSISSLIADGFTDPESPSFYPAAFHGVAASLVMLTKAPVIIAEHALLTVNAALVWPLGLMFLVGVVWGRSQRGVVALSGMVASAIPSFPFYLWVWGPLWPLHFGFAQVPSVLALVAIGLAQVLQRRSSWSAALLLLLALPGLSLAHTSATFATAVGGIALAIATSRQYARQPAGARFRWLPLVVLVILTTAVFLMISLAAPSGLKETDYDRVPLTRAMIGLLSLWSPRQDLFQFAGGTVLILVLVGVLAAFRSRVGVWIVASWGYFMVFGFLTSFRPASDTWPFTWPWYNLPVRIQSVAVIFAVPLAALGVAWLLERRSAIARDFIVLALGVLVGLQIHANVAAMRFVYEATGSRSWVKDEEAAALHNFSQVLPDDAVVAANPWRGGMYLYLVGPEETLVHTEKSVGEDMEAVALGLDRILVDPEICEAAQRQRVSHVITGGDSFWTERREPLYAGIDDVSVEEGFVIVEQADPYTLWKVPACQP